MADKKQNRKPMTSRTKAVIAMCVMLALTLCVSWLSIAGTKLDAEGVNILLPWLPLTADKVPASLTLGLDVGDGNAADVAMTYATPAPTEAPAEDAVEDAADEAADAVEDAADEAADAVEDAADAVKDAADEAADAVEEVKETVVEYTAEFKADLEKAKTILEKRLSAMGRMAQITVTGDNTLQVAYPKYVNVNGEDVSSAIISAVGSVGNAALTVGDTTLTGTEAFKGYHVQYYTSTNNTSAYALFLHLTKEAKELVLSAEDRAVFAMDGEEIIAAGNMENYYNESNASIVLSLNSDAMANAYGAVITGGALPLSVTSAAANAEGVSGNRSILRVILIIMWALVLLAAVYMIIRNRMVGLAATWSLWLYMVFFFFLVATVVLPVLTVLNWFAVILTVLFAVYVLTLILREMDSAIAAGKDARTAVRTGFQTSVKQTWMAVGCEMILGLLLMILPVTRQFGYILAAGAIVNALCCIGLIRWFAPCLTIVGNSARKAVSAKAAQ